MVIEINPKFTAEKIQKELDRRVKLIETVLRERLEYIGEEFVKNARENGRYKDQTGNLRNSIGYLLLRDGVVLRKNFRRSATIKKIIKSGKNKGKERILTGSGEGVKVGRSLAEEAASNYPKGLALIVVAGMDYAAAVESKGKDVLTGSSKRATKQLKRAIWEISRKIGKVR